MTLVSNDPSWWPTIDLNIAYSYWIGSSHQSVMSQSNIELRYRSCCRCRGGIRFEWEKQCSKTTDVLMIPFPVLTLGQEVGRCCCRSNQLAENGVLDWTDLGERQSSVSEEKQQNTMNLGQGQRWSLMTVLYLVVCITYYNIAWLASHADPKYFRHAILHYHFLCMY
jgi:hypothetical protein